jgi:hypothetical protein
LEVKWLICRLGGERLPTIDFAHVDLSQGKQRQNSMAAVSAHGSTGLCFDPSCELLVQALNCIRRPRAAPLARRQAGEGEQTVAGFLQAVRDGAVLEPPLADEGLVAVPRRRIIMSL